MLMDGFPKPTVLNGRITFKVLGSFSSVKREVHTYSGWVGCYCPGDAGPEVLHRSLDTLSCFNPAAHSYCHFGLGWWFPYPPPPHPIFDMIYYKSYIGIFLIFCYFWDLGIGIFGICGYLEILDILILGYLDIWVFAYFHILGSLVYLVYWFLTYLVYVGIICILVYFGERLPLQFPWHSCSFVVRSRGSAV